MTSNIEDLFGQIVSSEQEARKRKSQISEVKTQIQKCEEDTNQTNNDIRRLQNQLLMKEKQYNDVTMQVQWELKRHTVLEDQKQQATQKYAELKNKLRAREKDVSLYRAKFLDKAQSFCKNYDLLSNGSELRQAEWIREIEQLEKQQSEIQQEISRYNAEQMDLEVLSAESAEQTAIMEAVQKEIKDLKQLLESERIKTAKMLEEKQNVENIPQTHPEFQKLQRELSSHKNADVERECLRLEQQLQALQRQQWQSKIQCKTDKRIHRYAPAAQNVTQRMDQASAVVSTQSSTVVLTNYTHMARPSHMMASTASDTLNEESTAYDYFLDIGDSPQESTTFQANSQKGRSNKFSLRTMKK